ncbi:MAG: hypothetical protein ABW061_11475 [Polyangiaceae bacterium]
MIWNRFQLALQASFGCALLCAPGCGTDAAGTPQPANSAGNSAAGSNVGGAAAGAGSATAGALHGAGAVSVAGAGGASTAGASGSASVAGASGNVSVAGASGSAGTSGSASPCHARPGLLACDDFEAATLGAVPSGAWSAGLIGDGGSVAVDDSVPAHSGSKAVHVHGAGYQALLVYHDAAVLPQASGRFFVRAFVRLAEPMTGGHNTFFLADTFAAPNVGNALRVGEQNSMLMMTVGGDAHGYLSNQNFYNDHLPGVVFKPAEYSCLELLLDSPHTEIEVWVDGVDVPDLHVSDLAHENYDALRFGFEKYAGPDSDLWFDDIAIGTERVGCD